MPFPIEAPLSDVGRMINSFPGRAYVKPGVSGLVWTQITDVENERNGLPEKK